MQPLEASTGSGVQSYCHEIPAAVRTSLISRKLLTWLNLKEWRFIYSADGEPQSAGLLQKLICGSSRRLQVKHAGQMSFIGMSDTVSILPDHWCRRTPPYPSPALFMPLETDCVPLSYAHTSVHNMENCLWVHPNQHGLWLWLFCHHLPFSIQVSLPRSHVKRQDVQASGAA